MQGKSVAAKTILTAALLLVAIWTALGPPPPHRPEPMKTAICRSAIGNLGLSDCARRANHLPRFAKCESIPSQENIPVFR
jgi:hypothetical protein